MTYLLPFDISRLWVRTDDNGIPVAFTWQGRKHTIVDRLDCWKLRDNWWNQPVERDYYKVTTSLGWMVVIYYNWQLKSWHLERVQD